MGKADFDTISKTLILVLIYETLNYHYICYGYLVGK